MQKLSTFIMIAALLVMNIVSTAHAECFADGVSDSAQVVKLVNDVGDQGGDQKKSVCDCCATCGHYHYTHVFISHVKVDHFVDISKTQYGWDGGTAYLSQRHYPPSKPPKA